MVKITGFKANDFCGSNTSWIYMVVNASLRSYIIYHDQLRFSCPNDEGEKWGINNKYSQRSKVVNDGI